MASETVVFVVDADTAVRKAVSAIAAAMQLRAELHCTAEGFLDVFSPSQAGCLVVEEWLPGLSGRELLQRLQARQPLLPAIVLSQRATVATAVHAMRLGAVHFFEKPCPAPQLEEAIREAVAIDAHNRRQTVLFDRLHGRLARLSPGEREVLDLLLEGESNKGIAAQLGLSIRAVEARRAKAMKKMHAQSFVDLVQMMLSAKQLGTWKGLDIKPRGRAAEVSR